MNEPAADDEAAVLLSDVILVSPGEAPRARVDVLMRDGVIDWIGPCGALDVAASATRIPGSGGLCIPGLVNTHNHTPLMVVRGMVEDLGFAPAYTPGIPQGHWLSHEETCLLARLGLLELLKAGCTTVVDYYRDPAALAEAAQELNLRAFVGGRIMDVDTEALALGRHEIDARLGESTLADSQALIARWDGANSGLIRCFHAPHAPDTCSPALLRHVAELAAGDGRQVHTHLAQSLLECERVMARDGLRPTEVLERAGLLNERLFAAHCIYLDAQDIATLGKARVNVCHAPLGNAAAGALAPVQMLAEEGATITLCTDTKSADMFESMRMALAAARIRAHGELVLDASTVLDWSTGNGTRALSGHTLSGRLEPGSPADLVVLAPDAPNLQPVVDGYGIVVHSAHSGNVRHVICNGKWLLADGEPTHVDGHEIVRSAARVAENLWARARAA